MSKAHSFFFFCLIFEYCEPLQWRHWTGFDLNFMNQTEKGRQGLGVVNQHSQAVWKRRRIWRRICKQWRRKMEKDMQTMLFIRQKHVMSFFLNHPFSETCHVLPHFRIKDIYISSLGIQHKGFGDFTPRSVKTSIFRNFVHFLVELQCVFNHQLFLFTWLVVFEF